MHLAQEPLIELVVDPARHPRRDRRGVQTKRERHDIVPLQKRPGIGEVSREWSPSEKVDLEGAHEASLIPRMDSSRRRRIDPRHHPMQEPGAAAFRDVDQTLSERVVSPGSRKNPGVRAR